MATENICKSCGHDRYAMPWLICANWKAAKCSFNVFIRNCPAFKISNQSTIVIRSTVKPSKVTGGTLFLKHKNTHITTSTCASLFCPLVSLSLTRCSLINPENKSWFNKDNMTISLQNWLIHWLIVIYFSIFFVDPVSGCQKCSSHALALTTSGWLVREMMDRVYIILYHSRIAGLSSALFGRVSLLIIPTLSIPTVEPTPEHKLLFGINPKTHGR